MVWEEADRTYLRKYYSPWFKQWRKTGRHEKRVYSSRDLLSNDKMIEKNKLQLDMLDKLYFAILLLIFKMINQHSQMIQFHINQRIVVLVIFCYKCKWKIALQELTTTAERQLRWFASLWFLLGSANLVSVAVHTTMWAVECIVTFEITSPRKTVTSGQSHPSSPSRYR